MANFEEGQKLKQKSLISEECAVTFGEEKGIATPTFGKILLLK